MRGLRAVGFCGEAVSSADQLETAVKDWLAQPGLALLHVQVNPMQLVMPAIHASRAGDRNGALLGSRHFAAAGEMFGKW
jgi:thiamine pyrophosphate-dependent acetolactate synthase large subunit-like protein